MLDHVKELLQRAAAKTNDSSEEKHLTEFLNDILDDGTYDETDKLNEIRASAEQMKAFAELVIEKSYQE